MDDFEVKNISEECDAWDSDDPGTEIQLPVSLNEDGIILPNSVFVQIQVRSANISINSSWNFLQCTSLWSNANT